MYSMVWGDETFLSWQIFSRLAATHLPEQHLLLAHSSSFLPFTQTSNHLQTLVQKASSTHLVRISSRIWTSWMVILTRLITGRYNTMVRHRFSWRTFSTLRQILTWVSSTHLSRHPWDFLWGRLEL